MLPAAPSLKFAANLALCVLSAGALTFCLNVRSAPKVATPEVKKKPRALESKVSAGSRYPADAGLIDVKLHYGAKGDGVVDDTRAIQAALDDWPNSKAIIYLPKGTYLISDTIKWPKGSHGGEEYKQVILEGEDRDATIVRLRDACSGYRNARLPKAMIWTGPLPAQRFGNSIRSLTVHTGMGNAGAIGIQFHANNQGALQDVSIVSGDGQGIHGLDMSFTNEIGPLLVRNVTITGFEHGVATANPINGQVLENVTLRGQRSFGILDRGQALSIRNLRSENAVPAIKSEGGFIALMDSKLVGLKGVEDKPAIDAGGEIWIRNVQTTGYARALQIRRGEAPAGSSIAQFSTAPPLTTFPVERSPFPLPVEEIPEVPWDPPDQWANVRAFGAIPGDDIDDTAAFQAAIDSGATTVYLANTPEKPGGGRAAYRLDGTVFLRGKLRRLIGTESSIKGPGNGKAGGPLKLVDGEAPVVAIERIGTSFPGARIETESSRTLVLKNLQIAGYTGEGGRLFIEDVTSGPWDTWRMKNQQVWAWQFNPEMWARDSKRLGPHIVNDGGSLWVFGFKTEQGPRATLVETINGGKTEIIGGHMYTCGRYSEGNSSAMFVTRDGALSVFTREANIAREYYLNYVEETKNGETRRLAREELRPGGMNGRIVSYMSGQ